MRWSRAEADIDSRDVNEIERELATFGRDPDGGVIVVGSPSAAAYRKLIISLLPRYRLPNIYSARYYPADGGLASYGPTQSSCTSAPLSMWIASSKAPSRANFRSKRRPNMSWSSI